MTRPLRLALLFAALGAGGCEARGLDGGDAAGGDVGAAPVGDAATRDAAGAGAATLVGSYTGTMDWASQRYPGRVVFSPGAGSAALLIQAPAPPWGGSDWKCAPYDAHATRDGKFDFDGWSCLVGQLPLTVGFGSGQVSATGDLTMSWTVVRDCTKVACGAPQDAVSFTGTRD